MKLMNAKGTRDMPPKAMILREEITGQLKTAFMRYGFSPLETPIIERQEVLTSKYAGGDEILKEIFLLSDQGKRELGLRYDLTVPMCRFVGMNPQMKMPFKRYQIGRVFRDGPIKLGRYREFWQCDVDIVGSKSMKCEFELLSIVCDTFEGMGLDTIVKVNSRKVMNGLLDSVGIKEDLYQSVILILDKLAKFGAEVVKNELKENGLSQTDADSLIETFTSKIGLDDLSKKMETAEGKEGVAELIELFGYLKDRKQVQLDVSLARGLAYYTGPVFEVFLNKSKIRSAIAGGGRYDTMISSFLSSKQQYPAVGISFGLDVIYDAMKDEYTKESLTQIFVIGIGQDKAALKTAQYFRKNGFNVETDLIGRGPSKNLAYCNQKKIPHVIFIGEDEITSGKLKYKNMDSGKEEFLKKEEILPHLG